MKKYAGERNFRFETPRECDCCRKIIVASGGTVWFSQKGIEDENNEYTQQVQHNLGDYKLNKEYTVCWECILRRFGVKP